jgi:hypothetical protein
MNLTQALKSAKAAGDELARAIKDRQIPPTRAMLSFLIRETNIPQPLLPAFARMKSMATAAGSVPSEAMVTMAFQALSQWMIAVRNNELPLHSAGTEYARQLAAWLAAHAQDEDARRRADELVTQLTVPAVEWLSRTLIDNLLTMTEDRQQDGGTATTNGRGVDP